MRFSDQVVWITGASSGIGEALARRLAADGATLVLSARRGDELERVRRSCARAEAHRCVSFDLTQPDTFPAIAAGVLQEAGRVDVLVNNGGISQRSLALHATAASERQIMEVDYFAPVALTKAILPSMLERRSGQIVVLSSVMGYLGTPGRSSYAAAKHALHGYFDSLRAEIWRQGVAVTLVCPGYVRTSIAANALGPDGRTNARKESSIDGGIPPERCAAVIARAIAARKREVYVGGKEVVGIYLQRFVPGVLARIVRKMTFSLDAQA